MSKVAIILLNYNSTRYSHSCVRSLRSHKEKEDEYAIVVWDNASIVPPKEKDIQGGEVVLSKTNDGFACGYNKAVSYAVRKYNPDYLVILNNDTRVTKGMVSTLVQTCQTHNNSCIAVPLIYFEHGREFHKNSYTKEEHGSVIWYAGGGIDWPNVLPFHRGVDEVDRGQFGKQEETVFATGCCFCLTPHTWRKIGGFDEEYFMYFEDVDLSIRAKKKGIKLIFEPRAKLYHINAGSTHGSGSVFHEYYQTRNRLRFGLQYGKLRAKLALLREARRMAHKGTVGQQLGAIHALEGRWGNQTLSNLQKP